MNPAHKPVRNNLVMLFRRNTKEAMRAMDIKQKDVANDLGVSRQTINAWLSKDDMCISSLCIIGIMAVIGIRIDKHEQNDLTRYARKIMNEIFEEIEEKGMF